MPLILGQRKHAWTPRLLFVLSAQMETSASLNVYLNNNYAIVF